MKCVVRRFKYINWYTQRKEGSLKSVFVIEKKNKSKGLSSEKSTAFAECMKIPEGNNFSNIFNLWLAELHCAMENTYSAH